jgi:hypothetical protein
MKKKSEPVSPSKKNTSRAGPSSRDEVPLEKIAVSVASSEEPLKTSRAAKKPLFSGVVAAAKKMLKSRDVPVEAKTQVSSATVLRRTFTRRKKIETPPILLEGDQAAPPPVSGPGEKFALGPTPPPQTFPVVEAELPEAYGTKKLFLTARDPHWLYAHWDLTRDQQLKINGKSTDGHLVLRVYAGRIEGHPLYEIHVHPESRHWFAHVELAGHSYAAELGYYSALGKWMRVAVSSSTVTPPDSVAADTHAEYATIPFEFPFAKLMQIIEDAVRDNLPLAQAIEELRRHGHPDLPRLTTPAPTPGSTRTWTPQQEQALAKIISIDDTRRVWMGSLEITELIRRRLAHDMTSPAMPFGISSVSSPFGGMAEKAKNFWFNVNAELIIYGSTEPDAKVTLGGHEIKLRPDGTFSYRFALPDGKYDLPAVAVSSGGDDARAADLNFSRATEYLGDVGAHPQDPSLKPPLPQNI